MAIIQTSFTATAAIATNGTQTFSYPTRTGNTPDVTTQGDFYGSYGHQAFAEGLMYSMNSPKDFTLTFGNSSITFTYLGTTSIPANTLIRVDLHTMGQNAQSPYGLAFAGAPGDVSSQANSGAAPLIGISTKVQEGPVRYINFGTPLTASATAVVNASAAAESGYTVGTVIPITTPVVLDVPRNLTYKSSSSSDTTQTITARGFDDYGNAMTETSPTLTGSTAVLGLKAFKTVTSWQVNVAVTVGTVSIGSGVTLGCPAFVFSAAASLRDILNGAAATAGTWTAGVTATPTATTGDVRGTYAPNTAPSTNTNTYESLVVVPDATYLGPTQYAG